MLGLMATSKRTYANTCLPGLRLPVPLSPWQATADSHLCRRPSNTHRQVCLSLLWSHCSFPLTLGAHNILFLPSKYLSFPQSCGSYVIKYHEPSKSESLGIPGNVQAKHTITPISCARKEMLKIQCFKLGFCSM